MTRVFLFFLILIFFSQRPYAQDAKKNSRTTKLNFEDELIRGDITSPDLLFILKSKDIDYGKLLNLREDFIPEMRETKHDILRGAQ